MNEMLKKSHMLFFFAVLFGAFIITTSVSYAGVLADQPYASSRAYYKSHKGNVIIKWSKSYARLADGSVTDVSGYQIQYSKKSNFSGAKSIYRSSKTNKAKIKLKALKTKKKYKKGIKKYHFRVRSYIKTNGKTVYSKWSSASGKADLVVYTPLSLKSLKVSKNAVTSKWNKIGNARGYIIYNKTPKAKQWSKRKIVGSSGSSLKDKGLDFSTNYTYTGIWYRKVKTSSPAKYNTSYLKALRDNASRLSAKTDKYIMSKPVVRAVLTRSILRVTWTTVPYANRYIVQYSDTEDFSQPLEKEYTAAELEQGVNAHTKEIEEIEPEQSYYVRVMAAGKYKTDECQSGFCDPVLAKAGGGTYTIVFDGNSATSGSMSPITVTTGEEFTLPANTYKRAGYTFDGWCYKENNELFLDSVLPIQFGISDFADKDLVMDLAGPDDTITLYACWTGSGPEAAADWAMTIAADDTFVYGPVVKNTCWFCKGGNKYYVCNMFCASAYTHGMPYFKKYVTGNTRYDWWLKKGFSKVGKNVPMSKIKKGDIISCYVKKKKDYGHIIIAVTDGTDSNPRIAHAAGKGMGATSIREDNMKTRLAKYPKYYVVRMNK